MTRPLRLVTQAHLVEGRGSVLGPDTARRARWWELSLQCGHQVERSARYVPQTGGRRRRARRLSDVLPAPRYARCDTCGRGDA